MIDFNKVLEVVETEISNREKLEKLTREEKLELIEKYPFSINGKVKGFLWNTGEVGSYIPVTLTYMKIDWPEVKDIDSQYIKIVDEKFWDLI